MRIEERLLAARVIEKMQTILVRERANTRMRDFYDICVLVEMYTDEIKTEFFYF